MGDAYAHLNICAAQMLHRTVGIALVNGPSRPPQVVRRRRIVPAKRACRRRPIYQLACAESQVLREMTVEGGSACASPSLLAPFSFRHSYNSFPTDSSQWPYVCAEGDRDAREVRCST